MSLIAALAAIVALAVPADDLSDLRPEDADDVRCVAAFAAVGNLVENESRRKDMITGVFFYLGRLEGRTPGINWVDRTRAFSDTVTVRDLLPDAERCLGPLHEQTRRFVAATSQ